MSQFGIGRGLLGEWASASPASERNCGTGARGLQDSAGTRVPVTRHQHLEDRRCARNRTGQPRTRPHPRQRPSAGGRRRPGASLWASATIGAAAARGTRVEFEGRRSHDPRHSPIRGACGRLTARAGTGRDLDRGLTTRASPSDGRRCGIWRRQPGGRRQAGRACSARARRELPATSASQPRFSLSGSSGDESDRALPDRPGRPESSRRAADSLPDGETQLSCPWPILHRLPIAQRYTTERRPPSIRSRKDRPMAGISVPRCPSRGRAAGADSSRVAGSADHQPVRAAPASRDPSPSPKKHSLPPALAHRAQAMRTKPNPGTMASSDDAFFLGKLGRRQGRPHPTEKAPVSGRPDAEHDTGRSLAPQGRDGQQAQAPRRGQGNKRRPGCG